MLWLGLGLDDGKFVDKWDCKVCNECFVRVDVVVVVVVRGGGGGWLRIVGFCLLCKFWD